MKHLLVLTLLAMFTFSCEKEVVENPRPVESITVIEQKTVAETNEFSPTVGAVLENDMAVRMMLKEIDVEGDYKIRGFRIGRDVIENAILSDSTVSQLVLIETTKPNGEETMMVTGVNESGEKPDQLPIADFMLGIEDYYNDTATDTNEVIPEWQVLLNFPW